MKKETIKMILQNVNLSYRKTAPAFDCSENTALGKFRRGINIDDFIRLCDYANIKITLTFPDNSTLDITKEDI